MGFHGCHVRVLLLVDLYQIDDSLYIPNEHYMADI